MVDFNNEDNEVVSRYCSCTAGMVYSMEHRGSAPFFISLYWTIKNYSAINGAQIPACLAYPSTFNIHYF